MNTGQTHVTVSPSSVPTTDARASTNTLIASCQGLVRTIAWKIHQKLPGQVELDDLIAYGQLGLAQAARDFDGSRGAQFPTFAWYRIRGSIIDGLSQMSWFSRHAYHSGRYEQMANELLEVEARDAGSDARSPRNEADWAGSVSGALAVVYFASLSKEGRDEAEVTLEDPASPTPDRDAIGHETTAVLHEMIASLPADAGHLVRMVYFDGLTLQEAADRLNVSKSWASRLHAKTLKRLAVALMERGIDSEF